MGWRWGGGESGNGILDIRRKGKEGMYREEYLGDLFL